MDLKKILRVQEWWGHILPPILLFYYIGLLRNPGDNAHTYASALFIMFLAIITAITGYFLNDLFDIEEDKKGGKRNYVAAFPAWLKITFLPLLFIFLFAAGTISFPYFYPNELLFYALIYGGNVLLFLLYSAPPLRWKRSVYLSPVTDALYSGTLFYLLAFLIGSGAGNDASPLLNSRATLLLTFIWGLFKGWRNYLSHLSDDMLHDEKAGSVTLATIYGSSKVQFTANLVFPAEMICLNLILLIHLQPLWIAVSLSIVFLLFWAINMKKNASEKYVHLNDLHEVWLPMALLFRLYFLNKALYPLLIIHFLIFPYHLVKIYHILDALYFRTIFKLVGPVRKKGK